MSGLIEQVEGGVVERSPDGLLPEEQLRLIHEAAEPLRRRAGEVLTGDLMPSLANQGIRLRRHEELGPRKKKELHDFFCREVFPVCTPLMLQPASSVPFISNRSLNLAVELAAEDGEFRLARVKIPNVLSRLVRVPGRREDFVLLEDLMVGNLQSLFPGVEIVGAHLFRVLRDADVEIRELEAADLISTAEETIRLRRFGDAVLLQCAASMPDRVCRTLMGMLELDEGDVFLVGGPLGLEALWELARLERPSLRYPPQSPHLPESLGNAKSLFSTIASHDVLMHHPYDSFRPVEEFVASAARDPDVIGIKQTMYRVGSSSPIVASLLDAAEEGKQVAAMVELKARFDESNNLVWARALERAGVHVTYGFHELKTHCKLCLVVRREVGGVRSYAHIGTGNYNPATARLYTDLGLFTSDPDITQDVSELFNYLTGFSRQTGYRKLLVAPVNLREGILNRIRREADLGAEGRIILKLNALVDPEVIEALYEASGAGARVDLIIRGICCLRPGVPEMSENVRVVSIVGRFLEHSRIYYFGNGGMPDVLIGSADAMRRNLDRRIEVLVPVEDPRLAAHIRDGILDPCLRDTSRAWEQDPSGTYGRLRPDTGEDPFDSQLWSLAHPSTKFVLPS